MAVKVVVLDDSRDVRELLCMLLESEPGVRCVGVASVAELQARRDEVMAADLVILDINLGPDVPSGVDAHAWLTRIGFGGQVVFLTGHASSHPMVRAARAITGARVLDKPASAEELLGLVAE